MIPYDFSEYPDFVPENEVERFIVRLHDVLYSVYAVDAPAASARVLDFVDWHPDPPPDVPPETAQLVADWPSDCVVFTQRYYCEIYGPLNEEDVIEVEDE